METVVIAMETSLAAAVTELQKTNKLLRALVLVMAASSPEEVGYPNKLEMLREAMEVLEKEKK